jgi:hypothetical protein
MTQTILKPQEAAPVERPVSRVRRAFWYGVAVTALQFKKAFESIHGYAIYQYIKAGPYWFGGQ